MRTRLMVLVWLTALAGCAPTPAPTTDGSPSVSPTPAPSPSESLPPSPTGVPSPTPTEVPSMHAVLLGTVEIDSTGINVETDGEAEAQSNPDGSVRITTRLAEGGAPTRLELHVEPATVDVTANRGLAMISSGTGRALAGVPRPTARDASGRPVPTRMAVIDSALVFMLAPEERHEGEIVVEVWVGRQMIADVTVGEERGEPRYSITRTDFGRAVLGGGLGAQGARELFEAAGWEQALALEPALAAPASLQQQFECHVLGAPGKQAWNLESFRPDHPDWVRGALEHRCNWDEDHLPEAEPSPSPGG